MEQKTALVIGANRGIGIRVARELLQRKWNVVGTVRPSSQDDESVKELESTGASILQLDYTDGPSIIQAAKKYGTGPLDVLINNGAIGPKHLAWDEHTSEILTELFQINVIGPLLASKAFYPNLRLSPSGKIVNITSGSASIATLMPTGNNGMNMGYRMSKTALNQMSVTMAKEVLSKDDKITVIALYPGHLATRMSNFSSSNDMETSITGVVDVIENVNIEQTGSYLNWEGKTVPW